MSFYFFVASLPALHLGAPVPMPLAEFRAEVARLLPAETAVELEAVLRGDGPAARSVFARSWFALQVQLRNAVVHTRAARRGVDEVPFLRPQSGISLYLQDAVVAAYGKPNPLERELALDRIRWEAADEMARAEPFREPTVLAYGLQLQMMERWAALQDKAGQEALLRAVQQVREAAASG